MTSWVVSVHKSTVIWAYKQVFGLCIASYCYSESQSIRVGWVECSG